MIIWIGQYLTQDYYCYLLLALLLSVTCHTITYFNEISCFLSLYAYIKDNLLEYIDSLLAKIYGKCSLDCCTVLHNEVLCWFLLKMITSIIECLLLDHRGISMLHAVLHLRLPSMEFTYWTSDM